MNHAFHPLLFGGDINVYSVARAFHQAYGIVSTAYGKYPTGPCYGSDILDYHPCRTIEEDDTFVATVVDFARTHSQQTILLLGCGDSYVKLATRHRSAFPCNVVVPYISIEQMDRLTDKAQFYDLCDQYGIDRPATFVHRAELGADFDLPFDPPYVCKPSNGVAYWEHPFEGNEKVFFPQTRQALQEILDKVYRAGYPDAMIIQEHIGGDDSQMRVLTSYSDQEGKVKLMCLGHVLLEEHSPHGIGNHAVILTEDNLPLCQQFQALLEGEGFVGFSNFDIKLDPKDGKYKAFEINTRQGRSNFYVTGAGHNLAKVLVEDLVEHRPSQLVVNRTKALWRVVPQKVAYDYTPKCYHQEMKQLIAQGAVTNPLFYGQDKAFKRRLRMIKNALGHFVKFKKYYYRPLR